ncbi:MAG: arginine--tRNA ligase [Bacteroides sp.]|nr:arginine--tRNA ligase [Bacillota bacterium]MCM1393486.1 arginine--tRNA ligase [[Eubacterium] siraeum]MCM1455280.1 arginine--tRNA ligase [Bacteroides sp.]
MYEIQLSKALAVEGLCEQDVLDALEKPKESKLGDICLPCFKFARTLRLAPPLIAGKLQPYLAKLDFVERAEVAGGYLNIFFDRTVMAKKLIDEIALADDVGKSDEGAGKTICIDFSSVNIAKPFHIGHLSTTVIGGALYRIFEHLGYKVVGINHLGDWGTQFGKLIVATRKWSSLEEVANNDEYFLNSLYVRYHKEAETHPEMDDEARAWFKRIEDGDSEATAYFDVFKSVTMNAVGKVYDRLKIHFDSYAGESFYNDKMDECLDILREKNLLVESEGAQVVNLDEYNMPPCLLVKADGATLYATRDIAAAYYRKKNYDFDKCLYVVAYQQNLHFKQLFQVLKLMDFAGAEDMEHIAFGMVSMEDGAMSTRSGRVIWLQDVLDKAVEKALAIIEEKNPDSADKQAVAESVGVGAVVFSALWNNRIKDIVFSFDKVLNFDGETAPYVQYTYARCASALRKGGQPDLGNVDLSAIADDEGYEVIKSVLAFGDSVRQAAKLREPCCVTRHVVDLAEKFNRFYIGHRIVVDDAPVRNARLLLTECVAKTIRTGLNLLGIASPSEM